MIKRLKPSGRGGVCADECPAGPLLSTREGTTSRRKSFPTDPSLDLNFGPKGSSSGRCSFNVGKLALSPCPP